MENYYRKLDEQRRNNDINSIKRFFIYVCLPLFIIAAIAAFIMGALALVKTESLERFDATTNFESEPQSIFNGVSEDFHSTIAIPCTNKTLGDITRIFSGSTSPGLPCPKSDNTCSNFICGMDGYCKEVTIDNGECFSNSQCGIGFYCNYNCTCEIVNPPECVLDGDCDQFNANPCIEAKCNANICSYELLSGATCSSTTQCSSGQSCNSTCMCEAFPVIPECIIDSDCAQFNANPCIESKCTNNICSDELISGAECSSTTDCAEGFACNSTCNCYMITIFQGCMVDGDCQTDNSNPCVEAKCVANACETNLISGATCSSTTQCSSGQSCNSTCMCEEFPVTPECTLDADCDQFNGNPCIEAKCNANICSYELTAGATCSSTTQCSSGQSCNSTCMCEAFPVIPECTIDGDCDQFNANPCIESKCTSNLCSYELISGATCSSTAQCSSGQSCNSTCMCEEFPVIPECTIDADCAQFNANPCIESKCTSNTCSYELISGATCSSTTQCTSGFACNSTCMCEAFPVTPECTIDADCAQFNANPCVESKCTMNVCSDELIAGATCSSTTQCSSGQSCNSTCMCEENPTSQLCTTDAECAQFNANPCIEAKCNSNTCSTELIAGATCSSTAQCSSGQSCNSTCLCEGIPFPTTFSDATFSIYDDSDATKIAMFQASSITTSTTRTYTFPDVASSILAYTFTSTTGSATPSTSPWSGSFSAGYTITKVSNIVTITMDQNIHTFFGSAAIVYTTLIPSGYRPSVGFAHLPIGQNAGANEGLFLSVLTSGTISFSRLSGAAFSGAGNCGHYAFSISWTVG